MNSGISPEFPGCMAWGLENEGQWEGCTPVEACRARCRLPGSIPLCLVFCLVNHPVVGAGGQQWARSGWLLGRQTYLTSELIPLREGQDHQP